MVVNKVCFKIDLLFTSKVPDYHSKHQILVHLDFKQSFVANSIIKSVVFIIPMHDYITWILIDMIIFYFFISTSFIRKHKIKISAKLFIKKKFSLETKICLRCFTYCCGC